MSAVSSMNAYASRLNLESKRARTALEETERQLSAVDLAAAAQAYRTLYEQLSRLADQAEAVAREAARVAAASTKLDAGL
jgi:hypothetical protein